MAAPEATRIRAESGFCIRRERTSTVKRPLRNTLILVIILSVLTPIVLHQLRPESDLTVIVLARRDVASADVASANEETRWIRWLLRHWNVPRHEITRELPAGQDGPSLLYLDGLNLTGGGNQVVLSDEEISRIYSWAMSGTTVVAELATLAGPIDYYVREDLEKLLGVRSSGWIGKRIHDLASGEVPEAIRSNYEKNRSAAWDYRGGGIVFSHRDGRVMVLPEGDYTRSGGVYLEETDGLRDRGDGFSARERYFADWFMVVEPEPDASVTVRAQFRIDTNSAGDRLLEQAGIPSRFPAILEHATEYHRSLLLAGLFSAIPSSPGPARVAGMAKLRSILAIPAPDAYDHAFWTLYTPILQDVFTRIEEDHHRREKSPWQEMTQIQDPAMQAPSAVDDSALDVPARVRGSRIEVRVGDRWEELFVAGVNLGPAKPGRYFTDFLRSDLDFLRWFESIHRMNANTIRIYTLQAPAFYRALALFNRNRPENPLMLLHEIWPEEHPPDLDLLRDDYRQAFSREIGYVVDVVNGSGDVPPRRGRAHGVYRYDISDYVIGYLVGREIEPEEVIATDVLNQGYHYEGTYFSSLAGSPTEAWFAWACDEVARYEADRFGRARPISIVSWPPLDPLHHPSEWLLADGGVPYNDSAQVDIGMIDVADTFPAGFFGSYHIYPNYPDFIINNESYADYHDEQGELRFGGYLQDFMAHHQRYPALVAEFGIATGQGIAHYSPDGLHHGGLTEEEQGEGTIRMFEAIRREGYMGGVIFEWMDEWVKKTWTTEPFMLPFDRNVIWHNAVDPEQNYGILAHEAVFPDLHPVPGLVHPEFTLSAGFDVSWLHLDLALGEVLSGDMEVLIGFDTYDPGRGTTVFRPDLATEAPGGMEFLLTLSNEKAELQAVSGYSIGELGFASPEVTDDRPGQPFREIRILVNRAVPEGRPAQYWPGGLLRKGNPGDRSTQWYYDEGSYHVRIPWTLLNVTDPSDFRVLHHPEQVRSYPEGQDQLRTVPSRGIVFTVRGVRGTEILFGGDAREPLRPEPWSHPEYRSRYKESYEMLWKYLAHIETRRTAATGESP
jgi:mRNA-degrading endonuclease RelE of RelBE toxin-antitoxin system